MLVALAGCGDDDGDDATRPAAQTRPPAQERAAGGAGAGQEIEPLRCSGGESNCASATGEIVYVERVDPDGDGDAHFVLVSRAGVTAPGFTVVDVARDLRPDPLPGVGDTISAVGPVYRGSYGQRQIQATEIRVAER